MLETIKILYDIEAKIIKTEGHGISGRIFFEARSERRITEKHAQMIQKQLGYHPAGYGLFDYHTSRLITKLYDKNNHVARWKCSTSCD